MNTGKRNGNRGKGEAVKEIRENGMLSPVSEETPIECHVESAEIGTGAVVKSLGEYENT